MAGLTSPSAAPLDFRKFAQFAGAVRERFCRNAHLLSHRQVQVRQRSLVRELDVPARAEQAVPVSGEDGRQVVMIVIPPETAAVTHHGVVEQRAVAILSALQFTDEIRELLDLV